MCVRTRHVEQVCGPQLCLSLTFRGDTLVVDGLDHPTEIQHDVLLDQAGVERAEMGVLVVNTERANWPRCMIFFIIVDVYVFLGYVI